MSDGTCGNCGHRNPPIANFCASCGRPLRDSETTSETPAIDLDGLDGIDLVDRSQFGPHEGLFVVLQGPKAGARYALDSDEVSLGRHPKSDIFLDDITVSRRHAEVKRDGARYWVRDVGSLNGTYLNRERIDEVELAEGDELQVGRFKLVFAHGTGAA